MKRKTLKLKMSLWFTIVLTFICIIIIAAMLSIYRTTDRRFILQTLTDTVDDTASRIRTGKRSLSELVDSDRASRIFLETDVQLMVYDEDGGHTAGMFLFEELDELPFSVSDTPEKIRLRG